MPTEGWSRSVDEDLLQGELTVAEASREKLLLCEDGPQTSKALQDFLQKTTAKEQLDAAETTTSDTTAPEGPWHAVVPTDVAGNAADVIPVEEDRLQMDVAAAVDTAAMPAATAHSTSVTIVDVPTSTSAQKLASSLPPMRERIQGEKTTVYNMEDDAEDWKHGLCVRLPHLSRHSVASSSRISRRCVPLLEDTVAMTQQEKDAFKRLSQLASVPLDENNSRHEGIMKQYWHRMLGDDVPYEVKSPRWSDDLGFQSPRPWTDFRGGGLLALRCLLYAAENNTEEMKQLAEAAKFPQPCWYPFSAVGITICQMLAVHLRLHARPAVGPIRSLPQAHVLALKRFVRELSKGDPVIVFARYCLAAMAKVKKEWQEICRQDPKANVLSSFNKVYAYLGVTIESTFSWRSKDRLVLLDHVNAQSRNTRACNAWTRAAAGMLTGFLELENACCCRQSRKRSGTAKSAGRDCQGSVKPPDHLTAKDVYKLYRGVAGIVVGPVGTGRIWVDFVNLELRWATRDLPSPPENRMSLFDITWCQCKLLQGAADKQETSPPEECQLDVFGTSYVGQKVMSLKPPAAILKPTVSICGPLELMQQFLEALQQLLKSRDKEGHGVLHFVSKRLFQYLWVNQRMTLSEDQLFEAQAVLEFNVHPKDGIAYLKSKLHKQSDDQVGEWLASVCMEKGGLDPTMLGEYFSRRDTDQIFKAFMRRIDFKGLDTLDALRQLFDTFKPTGEGAVISRILDSFGESYFQQWQKQDVREPPTAFAGSDSVLQVAVSLIMLNTGIHIAPVKCSKQTVAVMTVEEYIRNTRLCVSDEEVPDETLRTWYDKVSKVQISVEPIPRAPFSKLPVQPDIEGRLVVVLNAQAQKRYWAVLVLKRLYLFTDVSDNDPEEKIDLKDIIVHPVAEEQSASERFHSDLSTDTGCASCCMRRRSSFEDESEFVDELRQAEDCAFEVTTQSGEATLLQKSCKKPRAYVAFVAESPDLMEKWVNHICP